MHQITPHTKPPPNSKAAAYGYGAFDYQKVGYNAAELSTSTNSPLYSWGAGNKSGQWEANGEEAFLFLEFFGSFCFKTKTNKDNRYFYHGDHLGSSSWITDGAGDVNQYLAYMPFGEQFIDQRGSTGHDIRFKFTGKERDSKTGYTYFGARYYDSELSVWLSVDPLADKYPSMSPFMYTAGNPVMLVDPDGMKWGKPGEDENNNSDRKQADEMRNDFVKMRDEYKTKYDAKYKEMQEYSGDRNSEEYKNMTKEAQELNAGYVNMQNGIQEIDRITNDKNYYTFSGNSKTFNTPSVDKNSAGTYTITINYNSSSNANKVHEVAHTAQIVDGKMTIHQNGNKYEFRSTYTLPNLERDAYIRQYFYSKSSMPVKVGSFKEIISLRGIEGYLRKINKKLGYEAYKF
jgi:RHS repeat-associated protein